MTDRLVEFGHNIEEMLSLLEAAKYDRSLDIGISKELMEDVCRRIQALEARCD